MPENPKQNKGIESGCNAGEPEIKRKGSNPGAMLENPKQNEGIECVQSRKEGAMPQFKASIPCSKPTTTHKVKVTKLEILQHSFLRKIPPH